ncbi:MAG: hypothetical protein AAGD25_39825 [Cyanobacteria bacterium P01_F01_bin.150]
MKQSESKPEENKELSWSFHLDNNRVAATLDCNLKVLKATINRGLSSTPVLLSKCLKYIASSAIVLHVFGAEPAKVASCPLEPDRLQESHVQQAENDQ